MWKMSLPPAVVVVSMASASERRPRQRVCPFPAGAELTTRDLAERVMCKRKRKLDVALETLSEYSIVASHVVINLRSGVSS